MNAKHTLPILFLSFFACVVSAQNIGDYRTVASGAWTSTSVWESYDGVSWIAASSVPSNLSGVINIRSPHVISLPGGTLDQVVVDSGATVNQAGWVVLENGTGVDLQINGTWNMASGYLYGPGVAHVDGIFNWDGGNLGAPGYITASFSNLRINAAGTLNMNGTSQKNIERGKIESYGTTQWNGGLINMSAFVGADTTSFVNHGIFYVGAGTLSMNVVTDTRFINSITGTFIKSTTGTVSIGNTNFSFYNYGLVNVTNGILTLTGGATLNNYGIIEANSPGAYNGTSTSMYNGSSIKGNGFIAMGYLYIGGSVTVDSLATVTHNSGYLYGPGVLTVHGTYTFNSGEIGTPTYIFNGLSQVQTSAVGTLSFNGSAAKTITRSQITNNGTCNWNGGDLSLNTISPDTTKFINSGVFNLGAGTLNLFGQAPARFINTSSGTVNKSTTGTFTTQQGTYFQNHGLLNISDGTFSTNNQNASFHNYDTILCAGSGVFNGWWNVNLYSGSLLSGNGTFTANGNWIIHGATVVDTIATISQTGGVVVGPGSFTVHGTYNMSTGEIGGPTYVNAAFTVLTISPVGTLNLNSSSQKFINRARVINQGTSHWNAGELHLNSTGTVDTTKFLNYGTFNIGSGTLYLYSTGGSRYINSSTGTVNKSTTGTFTIMQSSIFENFGLINISNGTFSTNNQNSAFHSFSEVHVASPGTFDGRWNVNLQNGAHFSGNGTVHFQGNVNLAGSAVIDSGCTANLVGGLIAGSGLLTIQGTLNWTGGKLGDFWWNYTHVVVDTFGSITLNGTTAKELAKTNLTNYGTIDWNDGAWDFTTTVVPDTCMLNNYGTVNLNTIGSFWNGQSNTHIRNMSSGLIYKPTSTFLTIQSGLTCRNQGTIQGIGTLVMNANFQSEGTISPGLSPGTLALNGQQPFATNSNLLIELNDASGPGTGHDLLTRNSNITLDGMLSVVETGNVPNGTYTIIQLSVGTVSGSFDTLNIPWYYTVGTTSNTVFLTKYFYYSSAISANICFNETFDFNGNILSTAGTYIDTLTSVLGFDSIITLSLNIYPELTGIATAVACVNYTWNGQTYSNSGQYQHVYTALNGCDSTVTLNLTIHQNSTTTISAIVCDSYTSPSGTLTWTSSGTYTETLTNSVSCDSVITYMVTINESTSGSTQVTACNSFQSPSGNYLWTQSGMYTDTITNNVWCDSVLTIDLTIENTNTTVSSDCAGLTAELSGASYQWVNCSNYSPINGANAQSFSPGSAGDYAVIITDGACVDTSACIPFESTGSGDPLETVNLYPNPASGAFYLTFPCPVEDMTVTIFNTAAQVMSRRKYELTSVIKTELILQSGTYIIQLIDKGGKIEYLRLVIL